MPEDQSVEVFKGVVELVSEQMGCEPEEVTAEKLLVDDLGFDSLDLVELTIDAEVRFDVSIADDLVGESTTVKGFSDLVESLKVKR